MSNTLQWRHKLMKELATTFLTLLLYLNAYSSEKEIILLEKTPPKLINNEKMASDIAEDYIKNIYGKDVAENETPYLIKDENEYWIVSGSLQKKHCRRCVHNKNTLGKLILLITENKGMTSDFLVDKV